MWRRRTGQSFLSGLTVFAVVTVTGAVTVGSASAATPEEQAAANALRAGLTGDHGAQPFFDGLTQVGAFASAQPALTLVPNDADALGAKPLKDALAALPDLLAADSPAALRDALNAGEVTLADGPDVTPGAKPRKATFAASLSSPGGVDILHVDVTIARPEVPSGIRLHAGTKPIDFSSAKGVAARPALHLAFDLVRAGDSADLKAGPVIALDTTAVLGPDLTDVDASLGILGVTLGTPPAGVNRWTVDTHALGTVRDPDNDGTLTTGDTGEIGADGASAGLGSVTVRNPGGGTLDGRLYIVPRPSSAVANLPGATIDVTATSANLATDPAADYADGALAPVEAFQRLAPFDLAQGIAQLVTTLDTITHARPDDTTIDVDLPLARGSLADLVPAGEALQQFLADHVTKSSVLGTPTQVDFASVQEFLDQLAATKGPGDPYDVTITGAEFKTDPSHPKLVFTVDVQRAASDQPTDPLAPMLTAGPTGLTYDGKSVTTTTDFGTDDSDTAAKAFRDSLKGRQINAGASSAVIKSVSGTTIALDPVPLGIDPGATDFWKNGKPSGVAYTIEAGEAKTGNVELGDVLKDGAHLSGANSANPAATTTAGYHVTLPLVLDLEATRTGDACKSADNGNQACPYKVINPDNSATVIAELPARPDRIQLGTGVGTQVLTARSSLKSPVNIRAPVGYVPVDIGGQLTLAAPGTADNMAVTTAALGDVPLSDVINGIREDADAVLTGLPKATEILDGRADITLLVPRAPTFFGEPANPGDPPVKGTASIDASTPGTPTVNDPAGDLADLAVLDVDPAKPSKLFDLVRADLETLAANLSAPPTAGVLGTTVPVLGTTPGQLMAGRERHAADYTRAGAVLKLTDNGRTFTAAGVTGRRVDVGGTIYVATGIDGEHTVKLQSPTGGDSATPANGTAYGLVDELTFGVDAMTAAPPSDLDALIGDLEARLGAGAHVTFVVDRTGPAVLRLHVDWPRTYTTSRQLLQVLSLNGEAVPLAGTPGGGEVPLTVAGRDDVTLVIPLTGAGVTDPVAQLRVVPTSERRAKVTADQTKALAAAAGSLALDLGAGSVVKADLTATAKGAAGAPVSIGDWATGLATVLTGTQQTCGAVSGAVCASLPAKTKAGATDVGTLTIAVPTNTTDLAPTIGDTTALATALAGSVLDLGPLGAGVQSYLDTAKKGLEVATAGGRVPLIGKDLQAGTDFLGKVKDAFDTALPSDKTYTFADAGEVRKQIEDAFADAALADKHLVQSGPNVETACDATLEKVGTVTATAVGAPDADNAKNQDYTYAVAAYDDGAAVPGQLSADSNTVKHVKVVTAGKSISLDWVDVPYADRYRVYRKSTAAPSFGLIGTPTGSTFSDDFSAAAGAAPENVLAPPSIGRVPCADAAPAGTVAAVTISARIGNGSVNPTTGECADAGDSKCLTANIPIDLGLPGISLKARKAADGSLVDGDKVTAKLGWTLDFGVTLDKKKGFLVETTKGPQPELKVGATVTLPDVMSASVTFLKAQLDRKSALPELAAAFTVDLSCSGTCAGGQLELSELATGGGRLTPKLKGSVNVDEQFATGVGSPGDDNYDPSLPGFTGRFKLLADWGGPDGADPLSFALRADPQAFGFFDVKLDAGKFLKAAVGPVVQDIVTTLKPVMPIIDTVTAPIPVLSDLSHLAGGDDVTLVTLAQAFGGGSESVAKVVEVIKIVKQLNEILKVAAAGEIDIGSVSLKPETATTRAATPDAADELIKVASPVTDLISSLNAKLSSPALSNDAPEGKTGFTFPALKEPKQLLRLLVGADVELARFDSGTLGINFTFSQKFGPVYAPPPVLLTISGSAGVQFRIVAGFDTYGIRQAVERGKVDVKVLDSLYFITKDASGKPIPVVRFTGELAAGAEVSVALLAVGVQGGLRLTVDFTWRDPNNDGKFRFSEFLAAALQNPICLFNVGGRLSLFLKVYVTIGFSPFSVSFDFTIADITLLDFSISPNCEPPPPLLGGVKDHVLYLFAGATYGTKAFRGDENWAIKAEDAETWVVRQKGSTMTVQALGITEEFGDVDTVVLDARANNDKQRVIGLFQGKEKGDAFAATVVFYGGAANDVVKTDVGPAFIDTGAGDDLVTTGDRPLIPGGGNLPPALDTAARVLVAGNGGTDRVTVGNAIDTVAGDGKLSTAQGSPEVTRTDTSKITLTGAVSPSGITLAEKNTPGTGTAGPDVLTIGLGGGTTYGGPGEDQIAVAQDSPLAGTFVDTDVRKAYTDQGAVIYGGTEADRISGGGGDNKIFTDDSPPGYDPAKPDDSQDVVGTDDKLAAGKANVVDTGIGNDIAVGANGVDLIAGHSVPSQTDVILGLAGQDVLTGGNGTDRIFGGRGDDYLVSQPADVTLTGADFIDVLGTPAHPVKVKPNPNPASTKLLVGGGASDRIYGGDGASTIFGDHVAVECKQAGSNRSDGPDEDTSGYTGDDADGPDLIYGGDAVDVIQAGGGNDWAYAKGAADKVCGMRGDDHLSGGADSDTVWGGRGIDVVYGESGDDFLYGNSDGDTLYGDVGLDTVEGNDGVDALFGGPDADTLIGGTSAADRADTGDRLYGDEGADVLIGDNGDPDVPAGPAFDLASTDATLGGDDTMHGGDGSDREYGGLANDTMNGNAADDFMQGGPGVDTMHGNDGQDDLVGGSTQLPAGSPSDKDVKGYPDAGDTIFGDAGDDVVLGDNGQVLRATGVDTGDLEGRGRGMTAGRLVTPYDLGPAPKAGTSGGDAVDGGTEPDLIYGQGGGDKLHGGAGDDYAEGDSGADEVYGDAGQDDLLGGSRFFESGVGQGRVGQPDGGDLVDGGTEADVMLGDNGLVHRAGVPSPLTEGRGMILRTIELVDLGDTPSASNAGNDLMLGRAGTDVAQGQSGDDVVQGGPDGDYVEGGPGIDRLEGNDGDDDLVGGSSTAIGNVNPNMDLTVGQLDRGDLLLGGNGDDVSLGDNGMITRLGTPDPRTFRISGDAKIMTRRHIDTYDMSNGGSLRTFPARAVYGDDQGSGGAGVDLILGQDGQDVLTGEAGDDYVEGQGGNDAVWGDSLLASVVTVPLAGAWQPRADEALGETDAPNGQDDLLGGSSRQGFRDPTEASSANDVVHGDGGADYELGDNGQVVRDILDAAKATVTEATVLGPASYPLTNRVYTKRYPATPPAGAAYVRHGVSPTAPTRFCTTAQATCEPGTSWGKDTIFGDGGDDTAYGQDGDDVLWGNDQDDDLYGELGNDTIDGGNGQDAIVGDRGGIVDVFQTGSNALHLEYSQVPKIVYDGFQAGSVTRQVDLQHDVNGDAFLGASGSAAMPHRGDTEGGDDRIRGRADNDSIHAGFGEDLANGDSGGDIVYGDDGADVLWGGRGSADPANPNDRGAGDSFVDYVLGGKGGDTAATKKNTVGADILDWHPRGVYSAKPGPTTCSPTSVPLDSGTAKAPVTVDPCSWFEMTDVTSADTTIRQHHQGIDWIYGGWDRDVLQGDVADNGPNLGDRLLDWTGAYNLYTHCNAAYGGYNDVRQHSPDMQTFLQKWAWATGAGQVVADATKAGTSAFDELALAYPGTDGPHSTGPAFPSTPGHFDNPNACAP